jgi:hypothetical protein
MYMAYMVSVDVPMWVDFWQADVVAGHSDLPMLQGLATALQRCTVVHAWTAWRWHIPWLTLYFSFAVWLSIALAHAPAFRRAPKARSY